MSKKKILVLNQNYSMIIHDDVGNMRIINIMIYVYMI